MAVKIRQSKLSPFDWIPGESGTGKHGDVWRHCCDQEWSGSRTASEDEYGLTGKKGKKTLWISPHRGEDVERQGEEEREPFLNFCSSIFVCLFCSSPVLSPSSLHLCTLIVYSLGAGLVKLSHSCWIGFPKNAYLLENTFYDIELCKPGKIHFEVIFPKELEVQKCWDVKQWTIQGNK